MNEAKSVAVGVTVTFFFFSFFFVIFSPLRSPERGGTIETRGVAQRARSMLTRARRLLRVLLLCCNALLVEMGGLKKNTRILFFARVFWGRYLS